MILNNEEKAWLLFKYDDDVKNGLYNIDGMFVNKDKAQLIDSLSDKGLVTARKSSNDGREFFLTSAGKKEAINIFKYSSANELEMIGNSIVSSNNSNLTHPDDSIFMVKKIEQKKINSKKN